MGWESPEASDDEQPVTRVRISRTFFLNTILFGLGPLSLNKSGRRLNE